LGTWDIKKVSDINFEEFPRPVFEEPVDNPIVAILKKVCKCCFKPTPEELEAEAKKKEEEEQANNPGWAKKPDSLPVEKTEEELRLEEEIKQANHHNKACYKERYLGDEKWIDNFEESKK